MEAHEFEVSIISANRPRLIDLLSNSGGPEEFKIRPNEAYELSFSDPIFIDSISILSDTKDAHKLKIMAYDVISSEPHIVTLPSNAGETMGEEAIYEIGRICRKISIQDHKPLFQFSNIRIRRIQLKGNYLKELDEYLTSIRDFRETTAETEKELVAKATALTAKEIDLETRESDLIARKADLEAKAPQLQTKITQLTTKQGDLEATISDLEVVAKDASAEVDELTARIEKLKAEMNDVSSKNSQLISESLELQTKVVARSSELRDIEKSLSVYSNEYSSFYKQSNLYIFIYASLCLIPMVIIGVILCLILNGAVDLTVIYKKESVFDITSIVLTRLPFVLVSFFILEVSYFLAKALLYKVFEIQSQKLALSKLAILAKDVVDLSVTPKITEEQMVEANLYLRMSLLKAYLSNEIGKDYEYPLKDRSIIDKIKSLLPGPKLPSS